MKIASVADSSATVTGAAGAGAAAPRVLIVTDNASAQFGGEAALPLHYFRVLKNRGIAVWLLTHARTRDELSALYPGDPAILYVEDTTLHRVMWKLGKRLPSRVANFTLGFVSRLSTQIVQRRIARRLVRVERISVVHQPTPVSPREPSLLFGLGAPVVMGPMNGGMDYPAAFRHRSRGLEQIVMHGGRASANLLNRLLPGKRRAALLLVANRRTRDALPGGVCEEVVELVENGVDLALWRAETPAPSHSTPQPVRFIFMGRLVDWKGVEFLLQAFSAALSKAPMHLVIAGEGDQRAGLEALVAALSAEHDGRSLSAAITFTGWLSQQACAEQLHEADCLVLPSLLECGGAVVLEAMSMGKPVIATAWGGPVDYLDPSCGILVPPSGREPFVAGLCEAMVRLATSAEERAAMGANGRRKVQREFDWDIKVDRMLGFYAIASAKGR